MRVRKRQPDGEIVDFSPKTVVSLKSETDDMRRRFNEFLKKAEPELIRAEWQKFVEAIEDKITRIEKHIDSL